MECPSPLVDHLALFLCGWSNTETFPNSPQRPHALHVAFYNLRRVHESLRSTPAMALGIAERVWTIGDLLDAALAAEPPKPTPTALDRRRQFWVIDGGRK
jgi:hypothetical protein